MFRNASRVDGVELLDLEVSSQHYCHNTYSRKGPLKGAPALENSKIQRQHEVEDEFILQADSESLTSMIIDEDVPRTENGDGIFDAEEHQEAPAHLVFDMTADEDLHVGNHTIPSDTVGIGYNNFFACHSCLPSQVVIS